MTTFIWKIDRISTLQEPHQNFVVEVAWNVSATYENQYSCSFGDRTMLTLSEANQFIAYEELKEEDVIGWLKNTLGQEKVSEFENKIQAIFDKNINPPAVVPMDTPLPWSEQ